MADNFKITITALDQATAVVNKINASMNKMLAPLTQAQASVNAFKKSVADNVVVKGLSNVGNAAKVVAEKVASIVAPMAAVIGVGSIAGVAALATEWGKLGFEITNTASAIGISTDQLQSLRGAAGMAGASVSDLDNGLKSVGDTFQNAQFGRDPAAMMMMNKLGISVHRLKDGSVDAARGLMDISRAVQNNKGNGAEAQRMIANAFGAGALLPMLQKGPAAIEAYQKRYEQLAGVMSGPALEAAANFQVQMTLLHGSIDGLKNRIGEKLIPVISPLIDQLTNWISANKDLIATNVGEFAKELGEWIKTIDFKQLGKDIADTAKDIKSFIDFIGGWKVAIIALAVIMNANLIASVLRLGITLGGLSLKLGVLSAQALPAALRGIGMLDTAAAIGNGTVVGYTASIGALVGKLGLLAAAGAAGYELGKHVVAPAIDAVIEKVTGDENATLGTKLQELMNPTQSHNMSFTPKTAVGVTKKLMSMGWTKEQAAGMAGSLQQESGLNPNARNASSGAYGIGQWLGGRVKDFKSVMGRDLVGSTLDDQLTFMSYEMKNGKEQSAGKKMMAAKTAEEAAAIHSIYYERPGKAEANVGQRQANAESILNKLNLDNAQPEVADGSLPSPTAWGKNTPLDVSGLAKSSVGGGGQSTGGTATDPVQHEVKVQVNLGNAPAGTTATAKNADGNAMPVRIAQSMPLAPG